MIDASIERRMRQNLRRTFGIAALREGQQQVIDRVLQGRSKLAVMPTGAGKSLYFQLPPQLLDGRTLEMSHAASSPTTSGRPAPCRCIHPRPHRAPSPVPERTSIMASSSITGGERAPSQARGRDVDALGPSDSSDSGSDVQGERAHATEDEVGSMGATPAIDDSDTDSSGTGERASAVPESVRDGADIGPDRIRRMGGGDALDHAGVLIDDPDAVEVGELATGDEEGDSDDDAQA